MKDENSASVHHGVFQAQGKDMSPEKFESWQEEEPPTKDCGQLRLDTLRDNCQRREEKLRERVFKEMERHIKRAPVEGYPAPHKNELVVRNRPKSAKGARVDLVVHRGSAFITPPDVAKGA